MPRILPKLKVPRAEAEREIALQIEKSKSLHDYELSTEGITDAETRFLKWNEDTIEMLTELFDSTEIVEEYKVTKGLGAYTGNDDISRIHRHGDNLRSKPEWLKSFKSRLPLYKEGVQDMAPSVRGVSEKIIAENRIFIGHGHSSAWRDLKDFLQERLNLLYEEFNREPIAGKSNKERLQEMLRNASFALIVMTAEDEHADSSHHARENVIHEAGLFQGKLGFERAIILLEQGCSEFSNVHGLGQIRFPSGNIQASFEEIRKVLEREKII